MIHQYKLSVKNGQIQEEEGSFFIAAPFVVTVDAQDYQIAFQRYNIEHVIYEVRHNDQMITRLYHPDYSPDSSPDKLQKDLNVDGLLPLFVALSHLKIATSTFYRDHYDASFDTTSFTISQPPLTSRSS